MKEKKMLIAGNWKMYPGTLSEAKKTFEGIKRTAAKLPYVQTVVCPPSVYIRDLTRMVSGHRCAVGAQNTFWEKEGAFTGEISPVQLADAKAKYVIIGHSERRALGETDEEVNGKVLAALRQGLSVILCVGETERDDDGTYTKFIATQVESALSGVSKNALSKLAIAYEPIWAIGKNALRPASAPDVVEVSILIRKVLSDMYGNAVAMGMPVLYGGSVDDRNAREFLEEGHVQGLLVGRASLNAPLFGRILETANEVMKSHIKK